MSIQEMYLDKRVFIKQGYGYFKLYPVQDFKRAGTDMYGKVYATVGNVLYLNLESGIDVSTSDFAVEIVK